jgi:hypothetical protein
MREEVKNLKPGNAIWIKDTNRRGYDDQGRLIYRKHWIKQTVEKVGRKYIYAGNYRVDINGSGDFGVSGVAFSLEEVERDCWLNNNRQKIISKIERLRSSYGLFKKLEEVLGEYE